MLSYTKDIYITIWSGLFYCLPQFYTPDKLLNFILFSMCHSQNGQMCAIKEVRVVCDDQASKECLKQLNQVILVFFF